MKKKNHTFCIVCCGSCRNHCFDFICRQGNLSSTIYNFVFLAVIAVLYLIAMFGGMFRMNNLSTAFHRAVEELNGMFKTPGRQIPGILHI